ncbi:MAG: SipW-dependent-type signal peptide-containing protein [Haloplanus sp.]
MTDERFDISRRKALAALGTIGVASAGAGLGTSAYFSDQETFENNQLVAGTLDMGVGYSAHYSDWMANAEGTPEDAGLSGDIRMYGGEAGETGGVGDLESGEIGLPTNEAWLIAVDSEADAAQFLENTQYDSFNDGDGALNSCPLDSGDQADSISAPVIDLDDVKPGDFGEVTFDFRLCDNPGFVWINGSIESASENDITEPEGDDAQEDGDPDSTNPDDIELLNVVQTAVWVDDGDNYQDRDTDGDGTVTESIQVQSLGDLLTKLNTDNGIDLGGDLPAMNGGGASDARNCFTADQKHSIGFAWWVPVDHGNQIQSDSVSFRLGLYVEQCRHNDGSGMNNEGLGNETDDDAETPTPEPV